MTPSGGEPGAGRRFLAIDSLRGVAALAVVFFHVQGALDRAPQPWMPILVGRLFRAGYFGVDIFFVLSGFVIAYSVREGSWTLSYLGRFALKRSLRLDPPYWTAIAFELALVLAGLALFPSLRTSVPSVAQILAHLFYLQDILGYGDIVVIFWTLCYEFQFYLTLLGLLVIWRALERGIGRRASTSTVVVIFGALFVSSVGAHGGLFTGVPYGIALDRWFEFFTGVLAWWVVAGVVPWPVLVAAWLISAGLGTRPDKPIELGILLVVSSMCMVSAVRPDFDRWFRWRPIQFLGAISYSLYLYHASVGYRVVSLAQHVSGRSLSPALGVVTFLVAVTASIAVATIGWRFVERPSQSLARHVRLPRRAGVGVADLPLNAKPAAPTE
jgi:peptidoglycan/LPS O-acetylase OafA/YrhL